MSQLLEQPNRTAATDGYGESISVHPLLPGYKAMLVGVSLLLAVPAILTAYLVVTVPLGAPGYETRGRIGGAVFALLLCGPFLYSIWHLIKVWNQKCEIYENGFIVVSKRSSPFVRWSEVRDLQIRRKETTFRYMLVPVATSNDVKVKIKTDRGRVALHSGFARLPEAVSEIDGRRQR